MLPTESFPKRTLRNAHQYKIWYYFNKEEFCHRRGVYFHKHRCTVGMACAQAVAIRSAPYVARRHADVPRDLPLRMANEWDRDEASERIRA